MSVEKRVLLVGGCALDPRCCDGASVVLGPDRVGRRLSDGECGDSLLADIFLNVSNCSEIIHEMFKKIYG